MSLWPDRMRTCHICGREFFGTFNAQYCPDCWTQPCCICGKPVELNPTYMTRFAKRGWITCSNKCASVLRRRNRESARRQQGQREPI